VSYQEKRIIVTIFSGIFVLLAYVIYTFTKYQNGLINPDNLNFWASTMLIFIGIGVVVTIIIQIVFHVLYSIALSIKEKIKNQDITDKEIEKLINAQMVTDEMDKLVELKSMRLGFIAAGIGFVLGLVSILLDYPASVMMNIIFISFSLGSLSEGFMQLHYYKKGIRNG
jgi:hypothetical protein